MKSMNEKNLFVKFAQTFLFHTLFILATILVLFIVALPSLLKTGVQLNSDVAFHAREIFELMRGRDFFLYYEEVNHHGILGGLAAIPFFKLMGIYPVPFSLPAIIFYGLFIWSTFLILREFDVASGWIAAILLLFPPLWVTEYVVVQNTLVGLIAFLGNLILFYLIRIKNNCNTSSREIFFFGFFSGFAIYAYTYSIIYIFTATLILTLTHPQWNGIRSHLMAKNLIWSFKALRTKSEYFERFLDIIIGLFFGAILFAYIFGGFGLDIGGVTLFQINNLHKPVIQVAILIILRLIIFRTSLTTIVSSVKSWYHAISPTTKKAVMAGTAGFLLGIFPRIFSVLSGAVTRGGQGFDMDFSPIRLVSHTFNLITIHLIEVMGFAKPLAALFLQDPTPIFSLQAVLVLPVAGLAGYATYSFLVPRWDLIKKIVRLESLTFNPTLVLLILPAVLCFSLIITQHGPNTRYLHPFYWIVTIYVALLIPKINNYSKMLASAFIGFWIIFYGSVTENHINELSRWREVLSPNPQSPIPHVVRFLKSNGIKAVYSGEGTASEIIMYSDGEIAAASHGKSARGKSLRKRMEKYSNFALVTQKNIPPLILKHLQGNKISFRKSPAHSYWVIWDLKGDRSAINQLRNLFD